MEHRPRVLRRVVPPRPERPRGAWRNPAQPRAASPNPGRPSRSASSGVSAVLRRSPPPPLASHVLSPERLLGRVLVVRPAAQSKVLFGRLAALRDGNDVVELEPRPRSTAVSVSADECALPAVATPHRVTDVLGDIPTPTPRL